MHASLLIGKTGYCMPTIEVVVIVIVVVVDLQLLYKDKDGR
jgi:hypothetical protein